MNIEFYTTFTAQIEVLPRFTIIYGREYDKLIAFEWLWFGVFIENKKP